MIASYLFLARNIPNFTEVEFNIGETNLKIIKNENYLCRLYLLPISIKSFLIACEKAEELNIQYNCIFVPSCITKMKLLN